MPNEAARRKFKRSSPSTDRADQNARRDTRQAGARYAKADCTIAHCTKRNASRALSLVMVA